MKLFIFPKRRVLKGNVYALMDSLQIGDIFVFGDDANNCVRFEVKTNLIKHKGWSEVVSVYVRRPKERPIVGFFDENKRVIDDAVLGALGAEEGTKAMLYMGNGKVISVSKDSTAYGPLKTFLITRV